MQQNKRRDQTTFWLFWAGVALLACGLALLSQSSPLTQGANVASKTLVAPGCKQQQQIVYDRCGHEVLRRVDVPERWVGMNQDGVLREAGGEWRVTDFSAGEIAMTTVLDLFCPQHWVLLLSSDGSPGIYRNKTGFGMERVTDASIGQVNEETRALLERGVAFDSREALENWAMQLPRLP